MVLILLFLSLIILLFFAYFRLSKDLLAPSVILIAVFAFSVFVAILNIPVWGVDIMPWTAFVIFSGLLAFLIGSMLANGSSRKMKPVKRAEKSLLDVSVLFYVVSLSFMVLSVLVYYAYVTQVTVTVGTGDGSEALLQSYRDAMVYGDVVEPIYVTIMNLVTGGLALFYLLIFANNFTLGLRRYKYLLPVLVYSMSLIVSSNRISFIYLVVAGVICFYLAFIRYKGKVNNAKLGRILGVLVLLFFLAFILLGNLTGKTQKQDDIVQNIAIYSGSSILALDDYLHPRVPVEVEPGSETLYGIANIAKRLGINIGDDKSRFLEQRYIGDMATRTNIYTNLRRLIHDYGYVGMYLIQFISGFLISALYFRVKRNSFKNIYFATLVYIFLIQTVVVSFIEEKLIVNIFTSSTLITFMLYFLLTRYILRVRPFKKGRTINS